MKMKVKNCTECEHAKTCCSYYGGLGCKMKVEEQKKQPGDKWKENIMKRFTTAN